MTDAVVGALPPQTHTQSIDERAARGRALREQVRRRDHAPWNVSNNRRDPIDQHCDTAFVGVKTVRLIELGLHCDTFEKEWIKRHAVDARKIGKDSIKRGLILLSPIRRSEHAEKQHFRATGIDPPDHLVEVAADGRRVDAAERVVGAERHDHQIGLVGERPIEPRETPCRGISGDPGINAARLDPPPLERGLEPRRKAWSGASP